jgi:response regulator NasT
MEQLVRRVLFGKSHPVIDYRKTCTLARRALLENKYDIVIIDCPLSEEIGYDFAMDICEEYDASVLIVTPPEIYDDVMEYVSDRVILALSKPISEEFLIRGVRFLSAIQNRMKHYENKVASVEDKMEELKLVNRAKMLLMEKKHITESEAHRLIMKEAMDHSVGKKYVARSIIDSLS